MFQINKEDMSIYATRGDVVVFNVTADDGGKNYKFQPGEVVRIKVYGKKDVKNVVLQKDFPVLDYTESVEITLTKDDMKIGEPISKPTDYWYEIELNPFDIPQTIIGYDDDGPVLFRLFPEGDDAEEYKPNPKAIPVVDTELDMTSPRPIANQAIARAFQNLLVGYERTHAAVAKLHVTPQMFGAIGDGEADDTDAILNAIDALGNGISVLYLPAGTYLVSENIPLVSNMTLRGDGHNSIIKRAGNNLENYAVIACDGVSNVSIENIHIQGERNEHSGTMGEWGMCVNIRGSSNVTVKNCKLTDAWGDGIYVGTYSETPCTNTVIDGCTIDNNRRQGISVINSDTLIVRNCLITNTNGTLPEAAIDFESNYSTDICKNNIIENCIFKGNVGGSVIIGNYFVPYEVTVSGCTSTDSKGVSVYSESKEGVTGGYFNIHNCNFRNVSRCISIGGKRSSGLPIKIKDCELYASGSNGICVEYNSNETDILGGLRVIGCTLNNTNSTVDPVRIINGKTGGTYDNILIDSFIEPSNKYRVYVKAEVTGNAKISVGRKLAFNSSLDLEQYSVFDNVEIKTESGSRRLTCKESFPYGCPIVIRKGLGSYELQIYLDAGTFPQFGNVNSVELKNIYDEITLIHESSGVWSVKDNTKNGVAYEA